MYEKYLITGASGFLGRAIISELLQRKAKVCALVMYQDPLAKHLPEYVHTIPGDLCSKSSLDRFFADADSKTCVIHCAGLVSIATRQGKRLYQVNVGGTQNILEQCLSHQVGRMIYVSSVHAIPEKPKGQVITEDESFSKSSLALLNDDYSKSKAIATRLVLDAADKGLPASVVLPSGIIGPGDFSHGPFTSTIQSFLAGRLPFAVSRGYDFVDVRDVAGGILGCAESGCVGKAYILSGHYQSIRQILQTVGRTANLKRPFLCLPLPLARQIAPLYEKRCLRRGKPLFFTPTSVAVLASNGLFSHKSASKDFGYHPRPMKNTLKDMSAWLQTQHTHKR